MTLQAVPLVSQSNVAGRFEANAAGMQTPRPKTSMHNPAAPCTEQLVPCPAHVIHSGTILSRASSAKSSSSPGTGPEVQSVGYSSRLSMQTLLP